MSTPYCFDKISSSSVSGGQSRCPVKGWKVLPGAWPGAGGYPTQRAIKLSLEYLRGDTRVEREEGGSKKSDGRGDEGLGVKAIGAQRR